MSQGNKDRSFYAKYFREGTVLHGLQSVPEEREWLMAAPKGEVKPAEVVLFLGCNVLKTIATFTLNLNSKAVFKFFLRERLQKK